MRIVILGPPGGGKGTQAALLSRKWHIPHISTGAMLRAAVEKQTDLGRKASAIMERGELVPDGIMLGLLERCLAEDARHGFILDGYPRNLAQAEALDGLLQRLGQPLTGALLIEVGEQSIVDRIARRACEEGRCDDDAETVRKRLEVYAEHTAPVADHYARQNALIRVLGEGDIDAITRRILEAVEAAGWQPSRVTA